MSRIDREVLRHLIFEHLKGDSETQFNSIIIGVGQLAGKQGLIDVEEEKLSTSAKLLDSSEELIVQELIWELIIQGILTPGINIANPNLPFVRVTEYGRRCLEEDLVLPHDYGTYLKRIKEINPSQDEKFLLYLEESVQAFLKGLYISCVIALGVASERLVQLLVEAYTAALKSPKNKAKFELAIGKARFVAPQFDELYKRLESNRKKFPQEISEDLEMIKFLVELIRKERNDAGHPTGRRFNREETLSYLLTFPAHYKKVNDLLNWLASNKL